MTINKTSNICTLPEDVFGIILDCLGVQESYRTISTMNRKIFDLFYQFVFKEKILTYRPRRSIGYQRFGEEAYIYIN